jgi:pyruvate,water dikinase
MKHVVWGREDEARELEVVGGKAANLAEMLHIGLPVPPVFALTAGAFDTFVEEAGIRGKLEAALEGLNPEDEEALAEAAGTCRELILEADVPEEIEAQIRTTYEEMGEDVPVAVRSSATAEDLPEASFAGQQDTFLHVEGPDEVLEAVRRCWASLYTPRAVYYRADRGFDDETVRMGVVVQMMVEADAAGVLMTRHPSTGADEIVVEAAWGLGEGVVSGSISPDNYVLDRDGTPTSVTVADKATQVVRGEDGGVEEVPVPDDRREARVLDDDQLAQLARLARTLEDHYEVPQDVEWAFEDGTLHLLQTRPITTIDDDATEDTTMTEDENDELLVEGLGAAPGTGAGPAAHVEDASQLGRIDEGDVLVTTMTTPDMVPGMKRASSIVTDEGGMTCHAAIVSRELGIPCVVGAKTATTDLDEDRPITVDGDTGRVTAGAREPETTDTDADSPAQQPGSARETTATEVKVNVSMPEATERAAATGADGVGLLRVEHIVLELGEHPLEMIEDGRGDAFVDYLVDGVGKVARAFRPDPVWVRTLDAPTDEFRSTQGGAREPEEANPMLGFRGIRRGLRQPELLTRELAAIARLHEEGYTNVGVMLPLVQHPSELREAKTLAREAGLDLDEVDLGVMIETPASALMIDELAEEGLDFVSFGTNDLTQYTLAVDRNNGNVADLFDEFHPAVGRLVEHVIERCNEHGVTTSICGQAGSDPDFAANLVEWGISSISANIDAVDRVRRTVAREEKRLLLDAARDR